MRAVFEFLEKLLKYLWHQNWVWVLSIEYFSHVTIHFFLLIFHHFQSIVVKLQKLWREEQFQIFSNRIFPLLFFFFFFK